MVMYFKVWQRYGLYSILQNLNSEKCPFYVEQVLKLFLHEFPLLLTDKMSLARILLSFDRADRLIKIKKLK